ncbi:FecR domain-containing protein [Roseomonas sp. GC11]|uniref:FecR family protein n=1 Tax=Roseomonas sp. GC11 TaxID=2950546 RepID=UPI00210CDAF5|nr:FecR domain-containing protein [Roseomonas sp. GC11]MCQ4159101.1 FecR domain-containing protein [Roseomonas sp. GC11]
MTGPAADPALEEALDWLLRLREAPHDAGLRRAHAAWLAAAPAHAAAWTRAAHLWHGLGAVGPQQQSLPHARQPARAVAPVALARRALWPALAAGIALPLLAPGLRRAWQADLSTGTGEQRNATLPDGSRIALAPRSALRLDFGPERRLLEVLEGGAFLEAATAPAQPLLVLAQGTRLRVPGADVDLQLLGGGFQVAVQRGQVTLEDDRPSPALRQELAAGESLRLAPGACSWQRGRQAPASIATWRDGPLFLQDTSLSDAIDLIGRYHHGWVLLRDATLGQRRLTGLYDPREPERALRAMVAPVGGMVRRLSPLLYLVEAA